MLFHPPKVVIYDCHCRGSKRYMLSLFQIRGPNTGLPYIATSDMKPLPDHWTMALYVPSAIGSRQQREESSDIRDSGDVLYIACSSCKVTVLRTTIASSESLIQVVMRNSTLQNSVSQGQMDSMVPGCSTYSAWYAEAVPHSARAAMATTFMLSVAGGRSVLVKAVDEGSRCWRRESVIGTLTA